MKKSPDSREFFYGRTQARKALKGVNVVEECKAKPLGASGAPAMKSIIRRDTGESYDGYLKRLAEAEGVDAQDAAALRRMDRKRKKEDSQRRLRVPATAKRRSRS